MSGLLAFMIMVSCSDGFKDCALAQPPRAYASQAACEAELERSLRKAGSRESKRGMGHDRNNILGRCAEASRAQQGNSGRLYWQVSQAGDLLADFRDNSAEKSGELYAENIYSQGAVNISGNFPPDNQAANSEPVHRERPYNTVLSFYSGHKKGSLSRNHTDKINKASSFLAGYSPKYIYETVPFADNIAYAPTHISVNWDAASPLGNAAFTVKPRSDDTAYFMPAAERIALHDAPLDENLTANRPAWQRIFYPQEPDIAPAIPLNSGKDKGNAVPVYNSPATRLTYMS